MRADLALEVQSQEREPEQEDSWELVFLVFVVCGRPSRLGEQGRLSLLLEEGKLVVVVAEAAPGATSTSEFDDASRSNSTHRWPPIRRIFASCAVFGFYGHKLGNFAVRVGSQLRTLGR
jgi:hypothetical protein